MCIRDSHKEFSYISTGTFLRRISTQFVTYNDSPDIQTVQSDWTVLLAIQQSYRRSQQSTCRYYRHTTNTLPRAVVSTKLTSSKQVLVHFSSSESNQNSESNTQNSNWTLEIKFNSRGSDNPHSLNVQTKYYTTREIQISIQTYLCELKPKTQPRRTSKRSLWLS